MTHAPHDTCPGLEVTQAISQARADYCLALHRRNRALQTERDLLASQVRRVQTLLDHTDAWAIPLDFLREALHGKDNQ